MPGYHIHDSHPNRTRNPDWGMRPMFGHTIISDDFGKTWRAGASEGPLNVDENQAVALPSPEGGPCVGELCPNSTRLMINARNEMDGCPNFPNCKPHHRLYAVSDDGGRTFGPPRFAEDLPEPICSAGLANHHGTLFFSNPDSSSERTHMTLKASSDSGLSWHVDTPIFAGHSAYSVVVPLIDATRVGVVYERGEASPYERVTLAIVSLSH